MQQVSPLTQQYLASRQNGGLTFNSPVSYSNGMASAPMPALMTQQNNDVYVPEAQDESQNADVQKADKKKKALKIAAIIAGIGAVAGIAYLIIKKKNAKDAVKQLSDVKFENGVVTLKDGGEKFTGTLEHTLKATGDKEPDKVIMEVKDGVLQKSTRNGSNNFVKEYLTNDKGESLVKITNGAGSEPATVNITEKIKGIKEAYREIHEKLSAPGAMNQVSDIIKATEDAPLTATERKSLNTLIESLRQCNKNKTTGMTNSQKSELVKQVREAKNNFKQIVTETAAKIKSELQEAAPKPEA